jgi:hypothetical protein
MRLRVHVSIWFASALLAAGCEGRPADPTTVTVESYAEANVAPASHGQPPSTSGPRVVRINGIEVGFHLTDPDKGWSVIYGFDIVSACQGQDVPFDVMSFQDIRGVGQGERVLRLMNGSDMLTSVWPFAPHFIDCSLFTTIPPLATGLADLRSTNNDVTGVFDPNVRAFGFMAHGIVEHADGSLGQYHGITRCVRDAVGPPKCTDRIDIGKLQFPF